MSGIDPTAAALARLKQAFQAMPCIVWMVDRDLRVSLSMGADLAHVGLSPDETRGAKLDEILADHPVLAVALDAHRSALAGTPANFDGAFRERNFHVRIAPHRDEHGEIVGVCGVALEFTERVRSEQRLRQHRDRLAERVRDQAEELAEWVLRFSSAFDTSVIGMMLAGPDGRCLKANQRLCEMLRRAEDDIVGCSLIELAGGEYAEELEEDHETMLAGNKTPLREVRLSGQDEDAQWVSVSTSLVRDTRGHPLLFVSHWVDITERKRQQRLRSRLLERLISAQEEERLRIARELHDETGQWLTSLAVALRSLEDALGGNIAARELVQELRRQTRRELDNVRRLSRDLRPTLLDDLGFVAAVQRYIQEYRKAYGLAVELQIVGFEGVEMPGPMEISLYRILQEALTNVIRHAQARRIGVHFASHEGKIRCEIEDDGCGMQIDPTSKLPIGSAGTGLLGIRERLALLGGVFALESTPDQGTRLSVEVPLNPPAAG